MTGDRSLSQPLSAETENKASLNLLDIRSSVTRVGDSEPVTKPTIPTGGEPTKPPEKPPEKPPTEPTKPPEKPPEKPPTEPTKPPEKPPEKPPTEPTKPPGEPTDPPDRPPQRPPERRRETAPPGYLELPDFLPRHRKEPPPTKIEVPPTKVEIPPTKVEIPPTKVEIPPAKVEIPPAKVEVPPPRKEIPPPELTPVIPPVVNTPEPIPFKPIPLEPFHPPLGPTEPRPPAHVPPTGVFTGRGELGRNAEAVYANKYTSGREMSPHHEHLIAPKIGLKVDVDAVGTGRDAGMRRHLTEMVPPKDHDHVGQWKYDVPGKTIIAGHVKYNGQPGPMFKLRELGVHNGVKDTVVIEGADGKRTTYEYSGRMILKDPHDQATWDRVFAPGNPERKQLTLVTCAGPLDKNGLHQWRLIVNLTEVKEDKAPAPSARRDKAQSALSTAEAGKVETTAAKVDTAPAKVDIAPAKLEVPPAQLDEPRAKALEPPAKTVEPPAKSEPALGTSQPEKITPPDAKEEPRKETVTAPSATTEQNAAQTSEEPPHPLPRLDVITNAGPGTHGAQTRFIYTHPIERHGALTGITGEVATTGDRLSYGQVGPNFSFLRDNDRYTLDSKLRLGYASGDNLFRSSNIPLQGLKGTTISGQIVGTDRISDNTRLYAGGGAGYNFDQRMKQGFVEAGAQHMINDKWVLRAGAQVSAADRYGVGTYAVGGVQYRPNKNTSIGLDIDQPISGRSSKSPTVFLSGTIRF